MQTQFSRYRKVLEHGTRYATCTTYFEAFWRTWATHTTRLPPDIETWHPQQFSTALFLSIAAGVEACQLYSGSRPDFWQVPSDPKPVSVSNRSKNELNDAGKGNAISTRITEQGCVVCQGESQQFSKSITTAGGVDVRISISIDDRAQVSGVTGSAGNEQGNGAG